MKIIGVLLLLCSLALSGNYFMPDGGETAVTTENIETQHNKFDNNRQLIPESGTIANPPTEITSTHILRSDIENPHLPIAYDEHQHNDELKKEYNSVSDTILEKGQSREFRHISQDDSADTVEFDNTSIDYFLQPGQSRTFSHLSGTQHIPVEE